MAKTKTANRNRAVTVEAVGQAHISASFNNIIVTITNMQGETISWTSSGKMGFRGSKKKTPYSAALAALDCGTVALDLGLRNVEVYVKGPGSGRESAIRTLQIVGLEVTTIIDVTSLPHNSCRPPTRRRV